MTIRAYLAIRRAAEGWAGRLAEFVSICLLYVIAYRIGAADENPRWS